MEEVRENKMGTQPIGELLFKMSLPIMISMLVQALAIMCGANSQSTTLPLCLE